MSGRKQGVCLNGYMSTWAAVPSGVPQGSVLGPVLFLITSHLDSQLINSVLKFADDTKLFARVNNEGDRAAIQSDLDRLLEWSDRWQMPFNTSKCMMMHLVKKNTKYQYSMDNCVLQEVTVEKDLAVCISGNLKPASPKQTKHWD